MAAIFRGYHTETAGTAILEVIPAMSGVIPRVTSLVYTNAGTEHTLTVMKSVGWTRTEVAAAASGNTLELTTIEPGLSTAGVSESLTANDYIIWVDENSTYQTDIIASASGNTVTLTGTHAADVPKGALVWAFYEVGRATHSQLKLPVSGTTTISGNMQGGFSHQTGVQTAKTGVGAPLLIHIDNITAAGKLMYLNGTYVTDVLAS